MIGYEELSALKRKLESNSPASAGIELLDPTKHFTSYQLTVTNNDGGCPMIVWRDDGAYVAAFGPGAMLLVHDDEVNELLTYVQRMFDGKLILVRSKKTGKEWAIFGDQMTYENNVETLRYPPY